MLTIGNTRVSFLNLPGTLMATLERFEVLKAALHCAGRQNGTGLTYASRKLMDALAARKRGVSTLAVLSANNRLMVKGLSSRVRVAMTLPSGSFHDALRREPSCFTRMWLAW